MRRFLVIGAVIMGAIGLTTLGIDAADTWRGDGGTMLAQLIGTRSLCPSEMVEIKTGTTFSCIDRYEVSPGSGCVYISPGNTEETTQNIVDKKCRPQSVAGAIPWRHVARAEAEQLCARVNKRLPSAEEWYRAALDTEAGQCVTTESAVTETGSKTGCQSAVGAYDMVGNVWEWVADDVVAGQYRSRPLPPSGYVEQADAGGVATKTGEGSSGGGPYGNSYFWARTDGIYGMIRGGFYGSRGDAGVYTIHAYTPAEFTGEAIGFRCVR